MNTILVIGATGAQGGSVARALLKDNKFSVRALTRNAASAKALELKYEGAEIVEGDLADTASLQKAMHGVYGVFGMTAYREHLEKEYLLGTNLADAAAASNVKHLVLSTLPDYNQLSLGRFVVPEYDSKAALQAYTKSMGLPASFIQLSFYYENLLSEFAPRKDSNNRFWFGFPLGDAKLAMASVEDAGPVVAALFDHPREYIGRTVKVVGADLCGAEYAEILSAILGYPIYYKHIPAEEYAGYDIPHAVETAHAFEVRRQYVLTKLINMIESYGLHPAMQSFKTWAMHNKENFRRLIHKQIKVVAD